MASCVEKLSHRFSIAESKNVALLSPGNLYRSSTIPHHLQALMYFYFQKSALVVVSPSDSIHLRTDPPDFGSEILDFGRWCM